MGLLTSWHVNMGGKLCMCSQRFYTKLYFIGHWATFIASYSWLPSLSAHLVHGMDSLLKSWVHITLVSTVYMLFIVLANSIHIDLARGERLKSNVFIKRNRTELLARYRALSREELQEYRSIAEESRTDKLAKLVRAGPKARLKDVDSSFAIMKDTVCIANHSIYNFYNLC